MSDTNDLPASNLPVVDRPRKEWPTISARMRKDEILLLDAIAYRRRVKRGDLIREAVLKLLDEAA